MTHHLHPDTIAATSGINEDAAHGSVMPPLYLSANYSFAGFDEKRDFDYTRSGNPTRAALEDTLAKLEAGAGASVTATGMAALDLVLTQVCPDDLVIAPVDCYGGTYRLLEARAKRGHFKVAYVDQTDLTAFAAALAQGAKLVMVESPTNPLMRVVDIARICELAHEAGALVSVDNTFLSPARQRPITLGADLVVHSTTKYLNGHSDVVGGAVVAATPELAQEIAWWANCTGVTGAPFDSYLTLRGIRTLFARIDRQERTAAEIAERLLDHPGVKRVHYPGLKDHPGHALAARQQTGFGAMLSIEIDGDLNDVRRVVESVKVFTLAESLGGFESLVAHPATMTHASMTAEAREAAGITDTLLRLSVGLEAPADLIADLDQALSGAQAVNLQAAE